MPIIPGDQLTEDQARQVEITYPALVEQYGRNWRYQLAFHFTRKGQLIVERGIYLRLNK